MRKAPNLGKNATFGTLRPVIRSVRNVPLPEKRRRLRDRSRWLRQVDLLEAFNDLFDHIPEYRVFLKRRPGEIMFVSRAMVRTLWADDELSLIGVSDHELTPGPLANLYQTRDEEVQRTGRPVTGLEVWFPARDCPSGSCVRSFRCEIAQVASWESSGF